MMVDRLYSGSAIVATVVALGIWWLAWDGRIAPADFALSWLLAMVAVLALAVGRFLEPRP